MNETTSNMDIAFEKTIDPATMTADEYILRNWRTLRGIAHKYAGDPEDNFQTLCLAICEKAAANPEFFIPRSGFTMDQHTNYINRGAAFALRDIRKHDAVGDKYVSSESDVTTSDGEISLMDIAIDESTATNPELAAEQNEIIDKIFTAIQGDAKNIKMVEMTRDGFNVVEIAITLKVTPGAICHRKRDIRASVTLSM